MAQLVFILKPSWLQRYIRFSTLYSTASGRGIMQEIEARKLQLIGKTLLELEVTWSSYRRENLRTS
jgi:hypothetical protein